jgi:hypothetical protein
MAELQHIFRQINVTILSPEMSNLKSFEGSKQQILAEKRVLFKKFLQLSDSMDDWTVTNAHLFFKYTCNENLAVLQWSDLPLTSTGGIMSSGCRNLIIYRFSYVSVNVEI